MLTPNLIDRFNSAAMKNGDDKFFAVMMEERSWFIFNWVFGLSFSPSDIVNCDEFDALRRRADLVADNPDRAEVLEHVSRRSWLDILAGTGIYMRTECVNLQDDEAELLREHKLVVTAFSTEQGRRYYVKDDYLDLAGAVSGEGFASAIFRPINSATTPEHYRPMIFFDSEDLPRGVCYAISEDNLRRPIDRSEDQRRRVEESMPELFGEAQ